MACHLIAEALKQSAREEAPSFASKFQKLPVKHLKIPKATANLGRGAAEA